MNAAGGPVRRSWQNITADVAEEEISGWRPGMAMCATMGVVMDVIDRDPKNDPRSSSWKKLRAALGDEGFDYFLKIATPSGGVHYYVPTLGLGRKYNPIPGHPGVDLQAERSLVFLPPTVRKGGTYRVIENALNEYEPVVCDRLRDVCLRNGNVPGGDSVQSVSISGLRDRCLRAGPGEQRGALLSMVLRWQFRGYDKEDIFNLFVQLVSEMPCFDERNPWYSPSMRNPEKWFHSLLADGREFIADATLDEIRAGVILQVAPGAEEKAFWSGHPVLRHIYAVAQSLRAAPWAVLGECLCEAVCHTPPSLVLPPLVGGVGSLNMLVALTGRSGAGKMSGAQAAAAAFVWHGVLGATEDSVARVPLGSGEGFVKSYGYMRKGEGGPELVRSALSVITTVAEIDTLTAVNGRAGSTLSGELRKFYSGEAIGFGYADASKRVIIPEHSYRGCVIAGVQPGRGEVILGDMDGGFAQRWLWLPASDPHAPNKANPVPSPLSWYPPDLDYDEVCVVPVCSDARDETDILRLETLRGTAGDEIESHSNFTRLKVACALGLLFGRVGIDDETWKMSRYVMKVSRHCRDGVSAVLSAGAVERAGREGMLAGVRVAASR
ncbi:MAG TPA: bifunctional DNA primase/polymerase [Ktedonobacteraceae bacterium]|nr:bifunctional DNA primase/polymerase [Ktedonobacteraceae bacterium]